MLGSFPTIIRYLLLFRLTSGFRIVGSSAPPATKYTSGQPLCPVTARKKDVFLKLSLGCCCPNCIVRVQRITLRKLKRIMTLHILTNFVGKITGNLTSKLSACVVKTTTAFARVQRNNVLGIKIEKSLKFLIFFRCNLIRLWL